METNVIYNEDCLETLKRLENESVDLVVTSPPYNKNAYASASGDTKSWGALRGRQIAYDKYNDAMEPAEYEKWQENVISECLRVLKPTGSIFYNHKDILVNGLIVSPKWVYNFPVHQQLIWDRGSSLANDPHYFQPITEYIYWIVKDIKQFIFNKDKSAYRQSVFKVNFEKNTNHPAPFPMKLINSLIASCTPPNAIVYDPFMGSGTTALSTLNVGEGRQYIGSEISPAYVKMANERIKIATAQLSLF